MEVENCLHEIYSIICTCMYIVHKSFWLYHSDILWKRGFKYINFNTIFYFVVHLQNCIYVVFIPPVKKIHVILKLQNIWFNAANYNSLSGQTPCAVILWPTCPTEPYRLWFITLCPAEHSLRFMTLSSWPLYAVIYDPMPSWTLYAVVYDPVSRWTLYAESFISLSS